MKTIFIVGAGRSSSVLTDFVCQHASAWQARVIIGDLSLEAAKQAARDQAEAIFFDSQQPDEAVLKKADIVVSLLPAHLHPRMAHLCLKHHAHLVTASYVSPEMKMLDSQAKEKGLLFLNECGLDPGIDHMSAMALIKKIEHEGGHVFSFESYTGGLVLPSSMPDNPWQYKFTWNPRNVVMAGQSGASYKQDGKLKFISYSQLFQRIQSIHIPEVGYVEGYANRDSLSYEAVYGLTPIKTILRGTLRFAGYCATWNILAQLGCCDDSYTLPMNNLTHREFIQLFLPSEQVEKEIAQRFHVSEQGDEIKRLRWSGFFDETLIPLQNATPAQITEHILNRKWKLTDTDRDLIVMVHRIQYKKNNENRQCEAWLTLSGENTRHTAMAKTVGLPLALAVKHLVQDAIPTRGVVIPVLPEIYQPILSDLEKEGIVFHEREQRIS